MLLKRLRFVSLLCAALVCGLTVAHALELPGKRQLSGPDWLVVQHTFYGGFAVVGGLAEILGLASTVLVAWCVRRRRGMLLLNLLAALGFIGMLLSYALGNRPINDSVASWTATTLPADWAEYRDRWDAAHTLSAAFATLTLCVLLGSVLSDTPSDTEREEAVATAASAGTLVRSRPS